MRALHYNVGLSLDSTLNASWHDGQFQAIMDLATQLTMIKWAAAVTKVHVFCLPLLNSMNAQQSSNRSCHYARQ